LAPYWLQVFCFEEAQDSLRPQARNRHLLARNRHLMKAAGGLLGGLGGLLDKLRQGGLTNVTNSWIGSGQNQPVSPNQVGSALGPNIIRTLAQQSGLSEDELTKQLSQVLPGVVDKLTPNGRLPTLAQLSQLI
jgi:uncharacterized protein YidB (DUF937 family)